MCGASGVGRSPTPDNSSFRACGRGPLPTGCWCGGCGRGDLSPASLRALLRPGFARCGGCAMVTRGGRLLPGCGASGKRRSPNPDPSSFWGVRPGPTTHWLWVRGVRAWGPVINPTARALASWPCALWRRHEGAWGGGASMLGVGRPGSGALPPPTTRPFGRAAGAHYPLAVGAGVRAWEPVTNPTARALASWICALWGRHQGAQGGRPLAWVLGVRGRALPHPRPLVLSGVRPGPTTHWLWVRGVRAWGPVTSLTARALVTWLCALWGRHKGDGGGRLSPGCGESGDRRSPTPDLSSFRACGQGGLPTGCGCGGCGRGDPSSTPQRALLRAGLARCGGGMGVPGGGTSCLGVGRPGSGALPTPTTRPFGRAAGAHYPLTVGAGLRAWEPVTNPTARALASWLCALWGRHEGARGGAPLAWVWGVRGWALSHPRPLVLSGVRPGPTTTGCGCGGCGRGDPSPTPQRALLRAGFACCGGRTRAPGGGASCLGVGRPGSGALPPPTTRPFGRAAGAHYPLAVGAGGAGVGTHHQPHSARSCELALRAVGAA